MEIKTGRLLIRRFRPQDWRDLYEYLSDPEVVRYEPYGVFTERECRREARQRARHKSFWAVCLADGGKLIGNLYLDRSTFGTYELGYVFNRAYHGKGYATEGAAALLDYAFVRLGARRIVARCNPLNTRSWLLMERLGMRREGHLIQQASFRQNASGQAIWHDTYEYAILFREWSPPGDTVPLPFDVREERDGEKMRILAMSIPDFPSPLLPVPADGDTLLWVDWEGIPAGCLWLRRRSPHAAEILLLYIAEMYRSSGIRKRLLQKCASGCRARGLRFLTLRPAGWREPEETLWEADDFFLLEEGAQGAGSPYYIRIL